MGQFKNFSMVFALGHKGNLHHSYCLLVVLLWVSPKKDTETKIWVQVVYLVDDPWEQSKRVSETWKGGKQ